MRKRASVVIFILSIGVVSLSAASEMKAPVSRIVSSRSDLERSCRVTVDIYACTAFEERQLDVGCATSSGAWIMNATASVQPVIYIWDSRWLAHEKLHIRDISDAVSGYVRELRGRAYKTESDCRRAAAAEKDGFTRAINLFAAESNARRH